ncbi:hypothetical protein PR202_gb10603 [Eleusine coracana subsp. coracana]|uniref:Vacuolar protein sorting-associated protein 35 n=1 Tax=Eleusine coracana subsp. coracana TaxID=191504 RepID=A0AAV5EL50_ELECO|nr:hypothetical protein PR202_gb10603 [Eleusine coracana subsp. coracana]
MAAASAAVRMLPDGGADDEERWLAEGIAGVQQNAFYMHRALDSNNLLKDALKYSAQMLSELRTSSRLSPHKYYELYMRAFDEMRKLEMFFREETRRGSCSVVDLYELVQHAGNVLPRLYLLCTVGSVYIKSKEAPAKDVLKDLVEMCRGIQHPLRGLFLRSYLSQISRDKLPDIGSEYEGDADSINDAVEFVLQNFIEMNKLWVRMQHQGPVREKEKRSKERNELRDLVGKNLHVLSQIEGVDLDMYKETVLPRILEQVLPEFLQVEAFAKFSNAIGKVIEAQPDMPVVGAVTLYVSLLTFTLRVHPDRLDYVDQVLGACVKKLSGKAKLEDSRATKQIVALLSAPLEKYSNIVTALELSNYPRVMDYLDNATTKVMAVIESLFDLIKGLIKDMDGAQDDELDEEDFKEEQNSVARLIHMLHNDDHEEMLKILCTVQKHILQGGPKRLTFTVPSLVFSALKLVRRLQGQDGDVTGEDVPATPKKIFQILHQTIEALSCVPSPELALRLYLQCAEAANDCDLEPVAYEFFTQAFILYEEEIAYSAKLLKKPDQCRAVYACSHLFWTDDQDGIMDGERYLYFFEKGIPQITNTVIQDLIELIRTEKQSDNTAADPLTEAFFASTLRYIEFQKQKGGSIGEKYEQIKTT